MTSSGFIKLDCPVCQRKTWHYQTAGSTEGPRCCDHSSWPPSKAPLGLTAINATIAVQGTMRTVSKRHIPRDRRPPRVTKVRAIRRCGCYTDHPFRMLCVRCLRRLLATECPQHAGYAIPLPTCGCQATYQLEADGGLVACGYCGRPTPLWGVQEAVAGRWGRVEKQIGVDAAGVPIMQKRSIPFLKRVEVCGACLEGYRALISATLKAKGVGAVAFLPP